MESGFLGRGWSFPVRFDSPDRGLSMVSDVQDIEESLRILLGTHPGERVLQPDYGCGIRRFTFEPMTAQTLTELKDIVSRAILFFEPRIALDDIHASSGDDREGVLLLVLTYTVRTTNTRHNMVYPFYLQQATNPVSEI